MTQHLIYCLKGTRAKYINTFPNSSGINADTYKLVYTKISQLVFSFE